MSDDHVIDIRRYLEQSPESREPGAFAVWGGGGERSRFALPLWRAIYLAGGNWGGIVSLPKSRDEPSNDLLADPLLVLDLQQDPARTESPEGPLQNLRNQKAPALTFHEKGGLAVSLGEDEERWWFLQVQGQALSGEPQGKDRETLLFLAGECAGLLFFRELSTLPPSSSSAP